MSKKSLVLRTCNGEMRGYGGFQWPDEGPVSAPDFEPNAECGHGLHGLLWGEGDGSLLNWDPTAFWLVLEVETSTIIQLDGKVKFPSCIVVHKGTQLSATQFIYERAPERAIVGGTATAGD